MNELRKLRPAGPKLGIFDMGNFCRFFKSLYEKPPLSEETINKLQAEMDNPCSAPSLLTAELDEPITISELASAIMSLKTGKAVGEDLIANEFFKATSQDVLPVLLYLYNECILLGVYPWDISPLPKKGSIYDPNNYRAIAVASTSENCSQPFSSVDSSVSEPVTARILPIRLASANTLRLQITY